MRTSSPINGLLIGLFVCFTAQAASKTAAVNIRANVVAACEVGASSGGSSVSFGVLDFGYVPNLNQSVSATGQTNAGAISIRCTNNTTYTVRIDTGVNSRSTATRYLSNGSAMVAYNLYIDSAHTRIWDDVTGYSGVSNGQQAQIPIYGFIPQQTTSQVGVYTDRVNITISY